MDVVHGRHELEMGPPAGKVCSGEKALGPTKPRNGNSATICNPLLAVATIEEVDEAVCPEVGLEIAQQFAPDW